MKKIKLGMLTPDAGDTTSFYRAWGPVGKLARDGAVEIVPPPAKVNAGSVWPTILQSDIVLVQRPGTHFQMNLCSEVKLTSRKLWIDFDDNLFDMPPCNPGHRHYAMPQVQQAIKTCCNMADLITVSTPELAKAYMPFMSKDTKLVIVPNAYDSEVFAHLNKPQEKREKVIVWRGSNTHLEDVMTVADDFVKVMMKPEFKDWKLLCFGDLPWPLVKGLPPDRYGHERLPMMFFHSRMHQIRPSVVIVPLADNSFNRAKSNIAYIEATMSGANTIANGKLTEFQKPGVFAYDNESSFTEVLEWVLTNSGGLDCLGALAFANDYMKTKIPLDKMNIERHYWLYRTVFGVEEAAEEFPNISYVKNGKLGAVKNALPETLPIEVAQIILDAAEMKFCPDANALQAQI